MKLVNIDRSYQAAILDIFNDVILNSTAIYEYKPRTLEMMNAWFDVKEQAAFPVLGVVDDDGTLIGLTTYGMFRNWPGYKYSVEHTILVERSQRGKGVGKLLLSGVIDAAKRQQYHVLIGGIDADNAPSIALHEQFGFERCATVKHAGYKFGRWLDLALYQLILPTPEHPVDG